MVEVRLDEVRLAPHEAKEARALILCEAVEEERWERRHASHDHLHHLMQCTEEEEEEEEERGQERERERAHSMVCVCMCGNGSAKQQAGTFTYVLKVKRVDVHCL